MARKENAREKHGADEGALPVLHIPAVDSISEKSKMKIKLIEAL